MNVRQNILAAALVGALFLTGCGSSTDTTVTEGTVSLPAGSMQENEEQTAVSSADTDAAAQKDAQSPASSSADAAVQSDGSFAEKCRFVYNGVTFGIGDSFAEISDSLGKQTRPSDSSQPCIPGAGASIHYYFPGMVIDTGENGRIALILLTEEHDKGTDAATVDGIRLGSAISELEGIYGTSTYDIPELYNYASGDVKISAYADEAGNLTSFSIENNQMLMK